MAEEIDQRKHELRLMVRDARAERSDDEQTAARDGLTEQLVMLVTARGAKSVSCYYPIQNEPNTLGFLQWARDNEVSVILPIAREDGLLDWVENTGDDADPGLFGIPEPTGEPLSPIAVSHVDLMLIPACAVDHEGNRIGWGRGYFDKTLGSMDQRPPVFAIVHDDEVLEAVPIDVHDVPVTGAVTPTSILHFE